MLGRYDVVDDDGVYRSKPKSAQNVVVESVSVGAGAQDKGGGGGRSRSRGSSLGGGDEDIGWYFDTNKK